MLDSDWCIVGSMMTVTTIDVQLEWNSISKVVGFTTSRNLTLPSDSGHGFRSDDELLSCPKITFVLKYHS